MHNSTIKPRPCRLCGKMGHSKMSCFLNAKPPIKIRVKSKTKKTAFRKMGKKSVGWIKAKAIFFKNNTGDANGLYWCKIKACPKPHVPMVAPHDPRFHDPESGVELCTVDHIIPRTKRPDLIYEQSNLQEAHGSCNSDKGSTVEDGIEYDSYTIVQSRRMRHAQLFVLNADGLRAKLTELESTIGDMKDYQQREYQTDIDFIKKELETRL